MQGALFDLDGVLVDTEGIYTEFWSDMDRRFPTGVAGFAQVIKGSTLTNILDTYFPDKSVQDRIVDMLKQHERDMRYRLFDGVAELLAALRQRGFRMAIVTSSNRAKMKHLFAQLPELEKSMDIVITDEDISRSKPDPEGYLLAAERLGIPAEECYIFEDSLNGLRAARAAGGVVVGVATTNPRKVVEEMSDITVDTLADFSA
ncbi:MAG: HAD family hydrolase [Muribaculaceae bacterium]